MLWEAGNYEIREKNKIFNDKILFNQKYGKYLVASEEVTVGSKFASALSFINDITKKDKIINYIKELQSTQGINYIRIKFNNPFFFIF